MNMREEKKIKRDETQMEITPVNGVTAEQLKEYIYSANSEQDWLNLLSPAQLSESLNELEDKAVCLFFRKVRNCDYLGEIFTYLFTTKKIYLVDNLDKKSLGAVCNSVPDDDLADFLDDVNSKVRERVISTLSEKKKKIISELSLYNDDSVGSIMTTEYLSILTGSTVHSVFEKIKEVGRTLETVRTLFVLDNKKQLIGVKRLEDLMFEDESELIDDIMEKDFPYVLSTSDKEDAIPLCKEYDLPVLPVISKVGEMLGIVTFDDVLDVLEEENTEDVLKQGAVSPNETNYMETSVFKIARSYVIWLVVLLVINTFTSIVISKFENALLTIPVLISFIPAINDSVGNSGSQTTSMVTRALTTDQMEKKDILKMVLKEGATGFLTGLIVAIFNFAWVMLELNTPLLNVTDSMKANLLSAFGFSNIQYAYMIIALIVSSALLCGIFFSKFFASILPVLAKALKIDPAFMSGPLVASLMDIMTLLIYFAIAMVIIDSISPSLILL